MSNQNATFNSATTQARDNVSGPGPKTEKQTAKTAGRVVSDGMPPFPALEFAIWGADGAQLAEYAAAIHKNSGSAKETIGKIGRTAIVPALVPYVGLEEAEALVKRWADGIPDDTGEDGLAGFVQGFLAGRRVGNLGAINAVASTRNTLVIDDSWSKEKMRVGNPLDVILYSRPVGSALQIRTQENSVALGFGSNKNVPGIPPEELKTVLDELDRQFCAGKQTSAKKEDKIPKKKQEKAANTTVGPVNLPVIELNIVGRAGMGPTGSEISATLNAAVESAMTRLGFAKNSAGDWALRSN